MKLLLKITALLPLLVLSFWVNGQQPSLHKSFLTVEDGLSHNEVTSIVQDQDGFIWIGTRGGLNRYDGYEFKIFNQVPGDSNSLVNPSIETLFNDDKGNIWIGTKSGGLNFFDNSLEQFSQINYFGKNPQTIVDEQIISINQSFDGSLLVGTWSSGLYILDFNKDTLIHPVVDKRIYKILVENENTIWLGTEQGLIKLDLKTQEFDLFNFGNGVEVTDIAIDKDTNDLWLVGWKCGLTKFNTETFTWEKYELERNNNSRKDFKNDTYSLLNDSNNELWVGTWGGGVYIFDKEKHDFTKIEIAPKYIRDFSTNYDIILDIYEDLDNNIWLGVDGAGVAFIGGKNYFNGISVEKNQDCGLKNFHIRGILETNDGSLWIGTKGGGLYRSHDKQHFELIPSQTKTRESFIIKYIYQYNDSLLWVATADRLLQLDISKEKLELQLVNDQLIREIKKVTSVLREDKNLIIGTQEDGIYILHENKNGEQIRKHITSNNDSVLKSDRITFFKKDIEGKIWIGTFNGLYQFDWGTKSVINPPFSNGEILSSNIVECWEQTSDSVIWIGTPNGLNKMSKNNLEYSITHCYQKSELPDNYIHAILSDTLNHIWLSTNSGIIRMNVITNEITTFGKSDGLQGMSFSEDKGFKSFDGTLYFGGVNGFNYFEPYKIEINKKASPIVFTKLKIYNQEIKTLQKVKGDVILNESINSIPSILLSHKQKQFTIEFAALNFIAPNRNKYKYKLEGYDSDWISLGNARSVTFRNLRAGDYVFKVKSANKYSVWNEIPAELAISVKPPFWKTWYALAFYIILITAIVLLIRWNAIKQIRLANNLEKEKLLHEQDQRISELKFQFFTNISHEFRTPLSLMIAPLKEVLNPSRNFKLSDELAHKIEMVYQNAVRLMKLVNQLLDFRKAETGNMKLAARFSDMEAFVNEVCIPFNELAKINNISFKIKSSLKTKHIWFDREKLEIIINNLLSNAFKKVNENGKIEVALFEEEEEILLSVSDNGPGIKPTEIQHIFDRFYRVEKTDNYGSSGIGLALTKRLVELHKGTISVSSQPNQHTEFIVALPKGNTHLGQEEIITSPETIQKNIPNKTYFPRVFSTKQKGNLPSGKTILVVDDNREITEYLKSLLTPYFSVEVAFNGTDGFHKALEIKPDLIISDVMMPETDGYEFCKKVKTSVELSTVPFILLTAKNEEHHKILGTRTGADDFISKPFDPEYLLHKIENLLLNKEKMKKQFSKSVRLEPSAVEITPADQVFIEKVIDLVEKNLQNPDFSSEVLAQEMNMSNSTLYRKLKELTDSSTAEFIRSIRIKRAAQLLAYKEKTVTEIAYEVGFNDVKHFRTVFQKQFGCAPTEYREKL